MSRPLAPSTSNNAAPLQRIVNWAADRVGISSPAANPPDNGKMANAETGSKKSKAKAATTATPAAAAATAPVATLAPNNHEYVRTRNAFITSLTGLTSSLDKFAKAYLDHSDAVIETGGVLDITPALAPLTQLIPGVSLSAPGLAVGPRGSDPLAVAANAAAVGGADEIEVDESGKKRRKRTVKPRDPNAPKRPMTAYFRFMQEQRPLMTEQFKNEPVGEDGAKRDINKLATERWKEMSEQQRESYHAAYRRDRQEYEAAMKALGLPVGKADMHEGDGDHAEPAVGAAGTTAVVPVPVAAAAAATANEESAVEEAEEEEQEAAPPPSAKSKSKASDSAKKTPRSTKKKTKDAAVPTPQFSSINAAADKPSRKRATADTDAEAGPRKRGRKSGASKDADAAAASAQLEQEQPAEPTPKGGKKDKKSKKRKSEAAE